jgi:hypothetical protein
MLPSDSGSGSGSMLTSAPVRPLCLFVEEEPVGGGGGGGAGGGGAGGFAFFQASILAVAAFSAEAVAAFSAKRLLCNLSWSPDDCMHTYIYMYMSRTRPSLAVHQTPCDTGTGRFVCEGVWHYLPASPTTLEIRAYPQFPTRFCRCFASDPRIQSPLSGVRSRAVELSGGPS